jgi:nitrogen fixation NifU-like protein
MHKPDKPFQPDRDRGTDSSPLRSGGVAKVDRSIPTSLNQLYQEVILDHYRRPRNKGILEGATHTITMNNPLCGDVIELMLTVEDGKITEARFAGRGCSISQASASMLTGRVKGKSPAEAVDLAARFTALLHGDESLLEDEALGDLRALAGVSKFPVRIKCALLGWNCLEELVGEDGEDASDVSPTAR